MGVSGLQPSTEHVGCDTSVSLCFFSEHCIFSSTSSDGYIGAGGEGDGTIRTRRVHTIAAADRGIATGPCPLRGWRF